MGLLVRFEDRAVPFVLAALRNVQRQVPVGGADGIMVANAISAVEGAKDEAEGHFIGETPAELAALFAPAAPVPTALSPTGTETTPAGGPASLAATVTEPATLTADQQYEADVAAAGEKYNELLLEAQKRLNAAHTAAL